MNLPLQTSVEKLEALIRELKNQNKSIAFCHGCFDLIHDGHLNLFKRAKQEVDILIAGLGSDRYIRETKGENRPKNLIDVRLKNILATGLVDIAFEVPYHDDPSSFYVSLYLLVKPDFLVSGSDEWIEVKKKRVEDLGIKIIIMPKTHSSTAILNKLNK